MTEGVSVVIPTLDEADSLPNCLQALAGQLRKPDEVIVVDGGSNDGTIELAKRVGCRVIVSEDSSIGEARGIGARRANNSIIATTDADALPPDGWVDRIRAHFEQDEELVVLWGNIEDRNGVPIRNLIGKFSTLFRGASGNNTAYRKEAFKKLESGYPDISFAEDFLVIERLSRLGKAKRDSDLVMVMDMDRKRYQTTPIVGAGLAGVLVSGLVGGRTGKLVSRASAGLVGTELLYENFGGSPLHHDDLAMALVGAGTSMEGSMTDDAIGVGTGMFAHHAMTEGISKMPTELMENTDEIL